MRFYQLDPEVDGGWGPDTEGDLQARPPRLTRFNYEFDVRPEDPLIEAVCDYIVTPDLRNALLAANVTGVAFGQVEITKSEELEHAYPGLRLPDYEWLQVVGQPGVDDFGHSPSHRLVVSEKVVELLRANGVRNSDIKPYAAA